MDFYTLVGKLSAHEVDKLFEVVRERKQELDNLKKSPSELFEFDHFKGDVALFRLKRS